ncbi:unnamed protein product [Urochloa humidicola]
MALSRRLRLAIVFAALVAAVFLAGAEVATAARPAPGGMGGGGEEAVTAASYLQVMDPAAAVVEKAMRETVEMLMARLPAGPSPRGPGH